VRSFLDLILTVLLVYVFGYEGRMIALLLSTVGVFILIKRYFGNDLFFSYSKSMFTFDLYTFKKAIPFVLITLITYSSLELDKLVFLEWLSPHEHGVYSLNSRLALLSLAAYEILSREYFRDIGMVIKENKFILFSNYLKSKIIPIYCLVLLVFLLVAIVLDGLVYNEYIVSSKYLIPQILVIFSLNIFKLFYSYLSINHLLDGLNKVYILFAMLMLLIFSVSMVYENVLSFLYGLVLLNFLLSVLIIYYVDNRKAV